MKDTNKLEASVIKHLTKYPKATVRDLQKIIGYKSSGSTQYFLMKMASEGKLKRIPASWVVCE